MVSGKMIIENIAMNVFVISTSSSMMARSLCVYVNVCERKHRKNKKRKKLFISERLCSAEPYSRTLTDLSKQKLVKIKLSKNLLQL